MDEKAVKEIDVLLVRLDVERLKAERALVAAAKAMTAVCEHTNRVRDYLHPEEKERACS